MTIKKEQLKIMMDLQTQMNEKVNPGWREAGYPWEDAILTEATEAYDHTYWAWWKNVVRTPDRDQIKMELVDIWHFILSEMMCHEETEGSSYHSLIAEIIEYTKAQRPEDFEPTVEIIRNALKNIMRVALAPFSEERISLFIHSFAVSLDVMDISWDELFKLYVGKNCLNQFRQENGYKQNSTAYKAIWYKEKGWEDNQYLTEILGSLDINSSTFMIDIKRRLQKEFDELTTL